MKLPLLALSLCIGMFIALNCKFYKSLDEHGPKIVANVEDATEKLGPLETSATHAMASADWAASSTAELAHSLTGTINELHGQIKFYGSLVGTTSVCGPLLAAAWNVWHRRKIAKEK